MAGLAHDVAGLVHEELKRDDGPRSVELRLGRAEQYASDPLVVIAPSVDKGRTKLDVYTQWGHECEGRKAAAPGSGSAPASSGACAASSRWPRPSCGRSADALDQVARARIEAVPARVVVATPTFGLRPLTILTTLISRGESVRGSIHTNLFHSVRIYVCTPRRCSGVSTRVPTPLPIPARPVPGTLVGAFEFVVFGVSMLLFTTDRLLTTSSDTRGRRRRSAARRRRT